MVEKIVFTEDEVKGMKAYSEMMRTEVSGENSPLGPNQRAELVRLCAECFGVEQRIPRLWFTKAKTRRAMLREDVDPDELVARIILAKCLVQGQDNNNARSNYERVAAFGYSESVAYPLRECLFGPYVGEIFHWEFNGYLFNLAKRPEPREKISFWLQWDYEVIHVPKWVPKRLRPFEGPDPDPY